MNEHCNCGECLRAGVDRPVVKPFGVELHGVELRDWWAAHDECLHFIQHMKDAALSKRAAEVIDLATERARRGGE